MDLRFTDEEEAFRAEVRRFIAENLPTDIRRHMELGHMPTKDHVVRWQRILNARGWATPSWKKEWGGPGWRPVQRLIFMDELHGAPAPEPLSFNVTMCGPVVATFGTEAQKRRFLPALANLDLWFCQGFSEPGAGSDLAALRTTARRVGEDYIVNGQKTWTSTAHDADWVFLLVRTDPTAARPQQGISFLLVDLTTPGITIRPVASIDRVHHLNEVFFDDVRVPIANRVGEENKGWDYAKFLLGNERTGIARVGKTAERLRRARMLLGEPGAPGPADTALQERLALAEAELKALEITQLRILSAMMRRPADGRPDPTSSILKLKGSELQQTAAELLADIAGPLGLIVQQAGTPPAAPDWAEALMPAYFFSRAATIYGGSSEVQKNIAAKAILGL